MDASTGRIVVGVDGSAGGRAALRHALAEAARRGAVVEAVIAVPDPDLRAGVLGGVPLGAPGALLQVVCEALRGRTAAEVEEVMAELPGPRPTVAVRVVVGSPADVLVHAAAGSDLLVVGTHRHGHLAGGLIGSVGRRCVLHARCPVTVVHAPGQEPPPRRAAPTLASAGTGSARAGPARAGPARAGPARAGPAGTGSAGTGSPGGEGRGGPQARRRR